MFNHLKLIHLPKSAGGAQASLADRWRQPPPGGELLLRATLPGSYNGGDLLWKTRAADRSALEQADPARVDTQAPLARVDSATYEDGIGGGNWNRGGVYRVLLLSLRPSTAPTAAARFEQEMLQMPRYIPSIRAWRLSHVLHASGARPWTHVWEQRYDTLEGLTGSYMMQPYHWAWVDRWFDPENPDWIVDPQLCHSYCALD